MANSVSKEECCTSLGVAYSDSISYDRIFQNLAGIRQEECKPCKRKLLKAK